MQQRFFLISLPHLSLNVFHVLPAPALLSVPLDEMGAFVSSSGVSDARVLRSHASGEQREETALPGICSFPAV